MISVDHPENTEAYIDFYGDPHTINRGKIASAICADSSGRDCSGLVLNADEIPAEPRSSIDGGLTSSRSNYDKPPVHYSGNAWVSDINSIDLEKDTNDYLYITLPPVPAADDAAIDGTTDSFTINSSSSGKTAKLIISGSETGLMSTSEFILFSLGKDVLPIVYDAIDNTAFGKIMNQRVVSSAKITLQIKDQEGRWIDYPYGPASDNAIMGAYETLVFPINLSLITDDEIRLKTTAFAYMIDFIGVDYSEDQIKDISYSEPGQPELMDRDDSRIAVKEGENLDISFKAPEKEIPAGYSRSYFLETSGYYHPLESLVMDRKEDYKSGIMDLAKAFASSPLYLLMYADSEYAKRYLIKRYLDSDFSGIAHDQGAISNFRNDIKGSLDSSADTSESGNPSVKHNTLYTDLIKVTVNTCTVLVNNLKVSSDTTLCRGKYHLVDSDYNDPSLMGIAQITGSNLAFDCDGSYISGGGEGIFGGQGSSGMAISINTADNVLIKNCNISGYKYGIGINNSVGTVIKDNEINYAEVGVGAQNSNNSLVYNNTVNFASSAAYSFAKGSVNNTLENNTALNNLLGFALETSHNNTIRNNIINASAWSFSYVGGIAVFTGSFYNKIDNNSLSNMILGLDLADAGISLTGTSHGFGGMWNNFSRNSIRHSYISSMGLMFPFPDDYFNYFERSNTADGENIYYYLNVHGTPSNYTQIRYLNLSVRDTSLFIGKITLVNCTYVNLSLNTLGNNFYNVVIVNSSNIIVQNNVLENATDTFSIYGNRGITAGVNLMAISSKDITIINNTAANGLFGYVFYNNSDRINFANNTARGNSQMGFYAYGLNNSYIQNNNISGNSIYGMYLYNMENSTINHNAFSSNQYGLALDHSLGQYTNNTISKNTIAGLYLYDHLGGAYLSGNMIENNTGAGISVTSSNKEVYSGLSTRNNSEAGIYVLDSSNITIVSPQSNKSRWGIKFSNSNNVHVTDAHTANNTDAEILFYNSLNNQIINSVIINKISAKDVNSSYNSDNYMLNTSFDRSNTAYSDDDGNAFSNLSVQWHLDFYVQSNESYVMGESIPVSGVNLSVSDSEGKNSQTVFTDSSGHSYFNVSEYRENSAGREYFSNYTWNLTKEGYSFSDNQIRPYITNTNMTENKFFNMSMAQQGGFNDTSPPSTPIVVDGPDYIDIDWFSSRSTLQASWYNSTDRLLVFYAFRIFDNGVCVPGYCAETDVGQNTSITINGLNLTEGHNYTFAVRARDSLFWFTPFEYSDGAIADFTAPTVAINSTTHPNQTEWYSNPNATFTFYGNDSLSGIKGFSYLLDDNPGTGPDLIADPRPPVILAEPKNNGYHRVLKTDGTGEAFAVFSQVRGNLSYGDNVAVSFQLSEDVSDRIDAMSVKAYLVRWGEAIDGYDNTDRRISTIAELTQDITHKDYSAADTYSVNLTVLSAAENYFYVAVAGLDADDNNTHNLSIAGTDSLTGIDNSTQALICGETSGCTNLTNTAEFAIGVRAETNSTIWTKSYANLANGMHWFHVRALDNAGNWGNPEHYAIQIDSVTGAPQFTTVKPRGYIATTNPTLVVETNEYAACYYNTSNSTHTGMTSYDGLHHESELSLSEGIYTYGLNCTDKSGNTAYNSTTFIINTSALPDMVSIWPMTNYTAGQKLAVNVNVTKAYGGVAYGLGELSSRFSANITGPDAVKTSVAISVTDKGGGLYSVSFTAPLTAGRYTLIVKVGNALDTETFAINSYSLTMRYAGVMDSAAVQENLVYWKSGSEYIIGLASDTVPVSITGTTSQLQLKYTAANGYGFIFMTDPFAIITNKQAYLSKGAFLDLKNPSFGHDTNEEEHVVSTILEYDDMQISGADNVYEGRYSLLIRNDGVNASSGKTKIKITIT
ncbi:MAG: right-handed parallel beta-helix repeat-containing protein [Candidatus Woesearchaeota archaeon]|nr:right-handed parallel beta-helix repeat-containing protein [Candidatus Woesearchaeota archaeon]